MKQSLNSRLALAAALLTLANAAPLMAQELERGTGFYVSWWKMLILLPFVWGWVKTCDFVNRDSQLIGDDIDMPQDVWTPIVVFPFMVLFLIALLIPVYIATVLLVTIACLAPLITYVLIRNKRVTEEMRVLTPAHLKIWMQNLGRKQKAVVNRVLPHDLGAPVEFQALGEDGKQNLIRSRQNAEAFLLVKQLIADLVSQGADRAMLDFSAETVDLQFDVDGVWHALEPRDRESCDALLQSFKLICNLDPADRRSRQQGKFKFKFDKNKYGGMLTSQGTATGERVVVQIDYGDKYSSLEEIGVRDKLRGILSKHIRGHGGMVLVSTMPSGGLSTLWAVVLKSTDRMTRDYITLQDKAKPEPDVENVLVEAYDLEAGETPDQMIPKILLRQPEVLVAPEPPNGETVRLLCHQVNADDQLSIISIRAKEAVEAMLRVLLLKVPADDFSKAIACVVNMRLIRKLCEKCKQAYEPAPQDLQRLGIPPGRIQVLYHEWEPPPPNSENAGKEEPPCEACGGIGFKGRTGLFEVIEVDDAMRQLLVTQPKLEVLRQAAKQSGSRSLQEEGILLLAKGMTSLQELRRVLKS